MKRLSLLFLLSSLAFAQNENLVEQRCQRLRDQEASLQGLLAVYTGGHPDVLAARREIERLRAELRKDGAEHVCRPLVGR